MLKVIRYVIFDLNGTLVIGSYPSWREVFENKLGLEKKGEEALSLEKLRLMAKGVQSFEEVLLRLYKVENPGEVKGRAFGLYISSIGLRENAIRVLEKLGKKYTLILCSDTTSVAKEVVKKFNIKEYFIKLFYSCEVGSLKSERNFWTKVLANFPNSEPSEFLVIGDSPRSDVYWPKRLGMHTILIRGAISSPDDYVEKPTGSIGEEPEYAIDTLKDILNYLDEQDCFPPKVCKKVGIYIFPNVEELDFVGVFEVLAKTRSMKEEGKLPIEKPLQVDVIASESMITCANGLTVKPHKVVDSFEGYDLLIVPGGRGIAKLIDDAKFLKRIKDFAEEHMIGSVCTGALVLGAAGLLKGKNATTHHEHREALKKFCEVVNSRVSVNGNVISAGGVSCSLDLGLKILEVIYGKKIAEMVANRLEIPLEMESF